MSLSGRARDAPVLAAGWLKRAVLPEIVVEGDRSSRSSSFHDSKAHFLLPVLVARRKSNARVRPRRTRISVWDSARTKLVVKRNQRSLRACWNRRAASR